MNASKRTVATLVAAGALVVVALLLLRLGDDRAESGVSAGPPSDEGPTATSLFASKLDDTTVPVNILIVGDDTGKSVGGWVTLVAQDLGIAHSRAVDVRDWDLATGSGYLPPVRMWDAPGEPLTVWNVSVARNVDFLLGALPNAVPPTPTDVDAVVVNTGTVQAPETLARETVSLARAAESRVNPERTIVVVQPVSDSTNAGATERSRVDVETSARKNGFEVADVRSAFDSANTGPLFEPGSIYPDVEGARVWASTVVDAATS
ncbi:hypothetical protein [Rhodococcus sp. MEB064]|uniref:hypothetical protein n=1 Tax=Rhodococcus sp. MEB064 TaxID=1587522 RepID=UPI0005AC17D3|nr:hypothetical protein [Rhodococcus sp. MEB064]KIQ11777.1 hypothetical protein RU01_18420 [Rhodococcus sp. MEB064]